MSFAFPPLWCARGGAAVVTLQFWDLVFGTADAWDKHVSEFPTFESVKAAAAAPSSS